jgi:hypothetical protein
MVVIAAFVPFYWWPIPDEIASAKPPATATVRDDRGSGLSKSSEDRGEA